MSIGIIIFTILLALLATWYLLKPHFSEQEEFTNQTDARQGSLKDEKKRLVQILRDLELDHDTEKVSDDEFDRMNHELRFELVETMKQIEKQK